MIFKNFIVEGGVLNVPKKEITKKSGVARK